jgi:cytochrome c-type biogenesis protein CcmH/NrfG
MAEVDDLVAEARARVAAVPDQRTLWLLAGEILVRLAAVEHELAELRKAARR